MFSRILLAVVVFCAPELAFSAVRTFTDHEGNTLKAELTGAKEGQVILKEKGTRKSFPLSAFVLDDRDYIVKWMVDKKQEKLLDELMKYERQNSNVPAASGSESGVAADGTSVGAGSVGAGAADANPAGSGSSSSTETRKIWDSMYGFEFPTEELVGAPEIHFWSDLRGQKLTATFEQVVSPGVVILKQSNGLTQRVPLVNLVREDLDYIHQAIEADKDRVVFPVGQYKEPTPEESGKGYRTWTDRRGEKLAGKYVRRSGRDTVFEVAGLEKNYPTVGLSKEDRAWVDAEERRKAEEARRQQEEANARARAQQQQANAGIGNRFGNPFGNSGMGGGSMDGAGGNPWAVPSGPRWQFQCRRCNNKWTGDSPLGECPNCKDTYDFHCFRCGHRWSKQGQMFDKCPKCSGALNNNSSGMNPVNNAGAMPNALTNTGGGNSGGGVVDNGGGSSSYRAGRLVGKVSAWIFAAIAGLWGVSKARGN